MKVNEAIEVAHGNDYEISQKAPRNGELLPSLIVSRIDEISILLRVSEDFIGVIRNEGETAVEHLRIIIVVFRNNIRSERNRKEVFYEGNALSEVSTERREEEDLVIGIRRVEMFMGTIHKLLIYD